MALMDDQNTTESTRPTPSGNRAEPAPNQTGSAAARIARNQAQRDIADYRWGRRGRNLLTLRGLGNRSPAYRVARRLIRNIEADLGGPENLTATERQMIQHGAVLGAIA